MNDYQIDVLKKMFGVFALVYIVIGTIANTISFFICITRPLKLIPTFIFIGFMLISDTMALYGLNLDWYFYRSFYSTYLSETNEFYCKAHYFIHLFPLKTSAWLLVSLAITNLVIEPRSKFISQAKYYF